jgi:hypothetical protein
MDSRRGHSDGKLHDCMYTARDGHYFGPGSMMNE